MNTRKQVAMVLGGVLGVAVAANGAWPYDQVDKVDVDPLETVVSGWKGAAPKAKRRVLYFSDCFGYNHHGGRCYGDWTFRRAGELSGAWELVQTHEVKDLANPGCLKGFDAIVFCNSSGLTVSMAEGMEDALIDFVKGGKGIALIHAGLDAFKDSDRLLDMFGGYFRGHPWHEDGTWKILNEAPRHPINASFRNQGVTFGKMDEIYQFPAFFNRATCNVLLSVDLSDPATKRAEEWWNGRFGPGSTRTDRDYAVSWTRSYGKGRIFYTTFGHDRGAFLDSERLYHMFNGLQFVLGDVDDGPCAPVGGPDVAAPRDDWAGGPFAEERNAEAAKFKGQAFDLVVMGDSITHGWRYPASDRYSGGKEVWERHFGHLKTANFGVSGDRTEHLLWRVCQTPQGTGWTAKAIFVMIGINNGHQIRPGATSPDTPEEIARGAKAVVSALAERHPEARIVLLNVLPARGKTLCDKLRPLIEDVSDGKRILFHDIGGAFSKNGSIDDSLFRDGLHPNPAGYEVFAAEIEKILK